VLRKPLWRAENVEGLEFPTVEAGFVSPDFRVVTADGQSRTRSFSR
jgi:hypothetical protein